MKLGVVVGSVICSVKSRSLDGVALLLVQPIDERGRASGTPLVACDTAQAGPGDTVLYEGGREAAMALKHSFNPSDAAVLAVVDGVNISDELRSSPR